MTNKLTGKLVRWDSDRGFGFLSRDDGQADVFLHVSQLLAAGLGDSPHLGDRFTFEIGEGRNGRPAAVNLEQV